MQPSIPPSQPPAYPPPMLPPPPRKDNTVLIIVIVLVVVGVVIAAFALAAFFIFMTVTPGPGSGRLLGTVVLQSSDTTNWTVYVTRVQGTFTTTDTRLTILNAGGATALAATALASLDYARDRAVYQGLGGTVIRMGDTILINTTTYPSGYQYQLTDTQGFFVRGTLA